MTSQLALPEISPGPAVISRNIIITTGRFDNLRSNATNKAFFASLFFFSFTGCVTVSGPIDQPLTIYMTWVAFEPADVDGFGVSRVDSVPFWTTGSKCIDVRTGATVRSLSDKTFQFQSFNVIKQMPPD